MVDGAPNTLTLANATPSVTTLTIGGNTGGTNAILNMEVGSTADQISLASTALASIGLSSTPNVVNIAGLGGLTGTTQTLINAPGGLASGSFSNFIVSTDQRRQYEWLYLGPGRHQHAAPTDRNRCGHADQRLLERSAKQHLEHVHGGNNTNWRTDATSNIDTNQLLLDHQCVLLYHHAGGDQPHDHARPEFHDQQSELHGRRHLDRDHRANTLTINATNAYGSNPAGTGITLASAQCRPDDQRSPDVFGVSTWLNVLRQSADGRRALTGSTALTLTSSGAGGFVLSGVNTGFTGSLTVTAGTLTGTTSANALGANTSTITLGDSVADASNVTLLAIVARLPIRMCWPTSPPPLAR